MSDELHAALTDIQGVGDATAEKIIETIDAHGAASDLEAAVDDALVHLDAGRIAHAVETLRATRG